MVEVDDGFMAYTRTAANARKNALDATASHIEQKPRLKAPWTDPHKTV